LDDLTEQLDATLLADPYAGSYALGDPLSSSGDGQTLSISQQQLHADDPFASLAAGATYGQLVAPQVVTQPEDVHQKQVPGASQSAAIAPPAHAADANPLPSNHELEPAAGHASSSSSSSFLPGSSGDGLVEQPSGSSISRIASPHWPAQAPAKDLPLLISVSEPIRKEGAGMLGMKGAESGLHQHPLSQPAVLTTAGHVSSEPGRVCSTVSGSCLHSWSLDLAQEQLSAVAAQWQCSRCLLISVGQPQLTSACSLLCTNSSLLGGDAPSG
jgi:hypothetical protein